MSNITPFTVATAAGFAIVYWQTEKQKLNTYAEIGYCDSMIDSWNQIKKEAEDLIKNKENLYVSDPKTSPITFRIHYEIVRRSHDIFGGWKTEQNYYLEAKTLCELLIKIGEFTKENNDLNYYVDPDKSERCVIFFPQILTVINKMEWFYTATEHYRDQKEEAIKELERQNQENKKTQISENKKELELLEEKIRALRIKIENENK